MMRNLIFGLFSIALKIFQVLSFTLRLGGWSPSSIHRRFQGDIFVNSFLKFARK